MNRSPRSWEPCSPGILQEAAVDRTATRRALFKVLGAAAAIAVLVAGTGIGFVLSDDRDSEPNELTSGIACISVNDHLAAYLRDDLQPEMNQQILAHLMQCKPCRGKYAERCCAPQCDTRPRKATFKPCERPQPKPLP